MSVASDHYPELHRLIDRLRPEQAEAVRSVVLQLVVDNTPAPEPAAPTEAQRRRRLSFGGAIEAEPDLATRSSDILREELGGTDQ
ncbi:hypothetical protein [Streptomyces sp. ISL-100]|uniref:hypothetical protein n=1 Tax=Streptomyces sp. ISL-100 TaxID=2819173 RepID=UPI001BE9EA35|nr:hypothetical protein [Streptomyces sp. ISL-100]MBT2397616.1 hypothetical protein [Streptomyces sp. ISL-100]